MPAHLLHPRRKLMAVCLCVLVLAYAATAFAAEGQGPPDSTLKADSSGRQTAAVHDTIAYAADKIIYNNNDSLLMLLGNAELSQEGMKLKADTILFHTNTRILEAMGTPILDQGAESVNGESMTYDMNTKKGKVRYGTARSKGDVYNGAEIGRMEDATFLVRNGDYSTCDIDTAPHYFFFSKNMKMIPGDKIIAKPVVLNIGDAPVGVLPFFIFPTKKGRCSGLLTPRWGEFPENGNRASYLNNVGYYFAINDYTDLETKVDFTNGDGFFFKRIYLDNRFAYNKRYWLNGNINGRFDLSRSDNTQSQNYGLSYSHNQNLFYPDGSFYMRGSGEIVGNSSYYRKSTLDREDYLKRQLTSNMAIVRQWKEAGITANTDFKYEEDLDSKENKLSLPSFSVSSVQRPLSVLAAPFMKERENDVSVPPDSQPWYEKIKFGYGARGINRKERVRERRYNLIDTAYDTSYVMRNNQAMDMRHDLSFSISPSPRVSYINISPRLSLASNWFFKERTQTGIAAISERRYYNSAKAYDTVYTWDTLPGINFNHREEFSTGLDLGTQLYGIAMLNLGPLIGFRHTFQPSVGYTFSPKLEGGERYISAGTANSGNRDEQQRIDFRANNTFQMKVAGDPEAENPKDKTISLMNLNLSTGYNFAAKPGTRKLGDLQSSASTNLYSLQLSYSGSHTFYDDNDNLLWSQADASLVKRLPSLRSLRLSASTGAQLSGTFSNGLVDIKTLLPDTAKMNPWNFAANFGYSYSSSYNTTFKVFEKSTTFSLRDQFTLNFTDNWRVSYSSRYDFENNELTEQSMDLLRNFHCWEANFHWIINGYRAGYYLRINIKEIPDIKIEKRGGEAGGMLFPGQGYYY